MATFPNPVANTMMSPMYRDSPMSPLIGPGPSSTPDAPQIGVGPLGPNQPGPVSPPDVSKAGPSASSTPSAPAEKVTPSGPTGSTTTPASASGDDNVVKPPPATPTDNKGPSNPADDPIKFPGLDLFMTEPIKQWFATMSPGDRIMAEAQMYLQMQSEIVSFFSNASKQMYETDMAIIGNLK